MEINDAIRLLEIYDIIKKLEGFVGVKPNEGAIDQIMFYRAISLGFEAYNAEEISVGKLRDIILMVDPDGSFCWGDFGSIEAYIRASSS